MPDEFHDFQPKLLRETCHPSTYPASDIFIGADLNLYVVFDRYEQQLRVFQSEGNRYSPVSLDEPRFWFEELQLGLGVWQGRYLGIEGRWLRWYDAENQWVPTDTE